MAVLWGLRLCYLGTGGLGNLRSSAGELRGLKQVSDRLREIEEMLESGVPPAEEQWSATRALPHPWGPLIGQSVSELRSGGGALLPTLKRLRELAEAHRAAMLEGKARAAQALSQAAACAFLVPVFSLVLKELLPGVSDHPWIWRLASAAAFVLAGAGALWLLRLSVSARWAGLAPAQRPWVLAAQCAGERFLALLRSGNAPDVAWLRACELLRSQAPGLALHWGYSVFASSPQEGDAGSGSGRSAAARSLREAGDRIRRAIAASVMEGMPCSERVESVLASLRVELNALIERELSLLGTRALVPLFACVAPALFGLLATGLALSWEEVIGNGAF